ncbi:Signal transduction histidine kinase [Selenomonas ruminantium]|uniref:Circadian input-output histidine kinase CikA n=1 Tax=Selenomonas ruminantium TaxID=971 RepID=A0A1M6SRH9_SELRU|nr:ATP-binding protein [Selenomonas ruminantium]SHK47250.1 Signal transduction histidine kinase [Selenomonas ruminantium]
MIQEGFTIRWETDRPAFVAKVKEILWQKKAESADRQDNAVYIHLLFRLLCRVTATQVRTAIREVFPQAVVTGISEALYGSEKRDSVLQMNMTFLESSRVDLLEYTGSPDGYAVAGQELSAQIQAIADSKAAAIYCAGLSINFYQFINSLTKDTPDISYFGCTAGMFEFSADGQKFNNLFSFNEMNDVEQQYVIGKDMYRQGIVLAVFSGKDLHVKTDYLFGWKELGKEMTITATKGNNCISLIDNMRPTEVYHRYLNVLPDENFVYNISEFPLAIERNGCTIARVPPRYDDAGRLYFSSDVYTGEKIRLTYAVHEDLLQETVINSEYMWGFAPQALFLTVCGNRTLFLKEKAPFEIDSYRRFAPHLICNYGTSEIYRYQNQGGILNSALVAAGLREGEPHLKLSDMDITTQRKEHRIIPLSERMATFLAAVTRELDESNKELRAMAHTAEAANLAKSQFLSNISHEIRTPINAVLGMDEMILRETHEPHTREYAENIRNAGNTLLGLINDILDFSKIEAGKMEIIPVEYAVSSCLNDLANMMRQRAEKKGLAFYVEAAEDLPSVLKGDEIRLRQVVTNILTNAVKYTETGSVTLRLSWTPTDTPNEIRLRIEVEDTGIGIKEEDISKLFHAFERIEEERNRTIEGTGLGMNITQRLLELMDSHLEVESRYGEGSCFAFAICQQVLNWTPMGNYEAAYRQQISQQSTYRESFIAPEARILIVDDTAMNLTVAKSLLKQTRVQTDTALSGYECLERLQTTAYDLILLDHRMPGMDGIETLTKIKELRLEENFPNRHTTVIALTANAISGAREEYITAGFDDYLTKPIDSHLLENMLCKYLPAEKVRPAGMPEPTEQEAALPAWLSDVPGLDLNAGIEHCGSVSDYLDALTVFVQSIESGSTEIERFYQLQDWNNYTTKVHALKSTARIIGAGELSEKARRLEDAGNNGYYEEILANNNALMALYRSFLRNLAPLRPQEKANDEKAPISASEVAEAWEALQEIAASFDYDSLTYMLTELSGYQLAEADAERLAAVKKAAAVPD